MFFVKPGGGRIVGDKFRCEASFKKESAFSFTRATVCALIQYRFTVRELESFNYLFLDKIELVVKV